MDLSVLLAFLVAALFVWLPCSCILLPKVPIVGTPLQTAKQFKPFEKLFQKKTPGLLGFKPTKEDLLRRESPDAYDSASDEDASDPLIYQPYDVKYVEFLINHQETDFDRETLRYWRKDARENKFTNFDPTW
ncbi:uncharacterized protein LOC132192918 [Neocloeon triangulifer]|uniref:uncharacterized protein LOC132192918 n=1 Tax=Neocloeon triangulifer TaxID=2078957 RepID=UPI00286F6E1F|nr:uncharacterized protein LOC132192918 [Neocloeon triangulifer]